MTTPDSGSGADRSAGAGFVAFLALTAFLTAAGLFFFWAAENTVLLNPDVREILPPTWVPVVEELGKWMARGLAVFFLGLAAIGLGSLVADVIAGLRQRLSVRSKVGRGHGPPEGLEEDAVVTSPDGERPAKRRGTNQPLLTRLELWFREHKTITAMAGAVIGFIITEIIFPIFIS